MTVSKEQAQALLDAATPGPWHANSAAEMEAGACGHVNGPLEAVAGRNYLIVPVVADDTRSPEDAALIAAAPDLARTVVEQAEGIERVRAALDRDEHVVDVQRHTFGLQHGFPCRPDLLGCPVNRALEALDDAPAPLGRYRVSLDQRGGVVIGERVADDYDPLDLRAVLDGAA